LTDYKFKGVGSFPEQYMRDVWCEVALGLQVFRLAIRFSPVAVTHPVIPKSFIIQGMDEGPIAAATFMQTWSWERARYKGRMKQRQKRE
jgi:hypothetical protein